MRRGWLLLSLAVSACSPWNQGPLSSPGSPGAASPAPEALVLYGRSREVTWQARMVPVNGAYATASAHVINPEAIPGIAQQDPNDCGAAAIATLLGFYGLRPSGDPDPLTAVKQGLVTRQWGTTLEDATTYLNQMGLSARSYRDGTSDRILETAMSGRPVPVVITLDSELTRMHWLVILGDAQTRDGQRFVLCKNPSNHDPSDLAVYPLAQFESQWDNAPLRSQWWSSWVSGLSDLDPDSYHRPWIDVGAVSPL